MERISILFGTYARADSVVLSHPNGSTPGQRIFSRCHIPDDLAVNGARDTVLELEVHLWDGVLWEDRGVGDITWKVLVVFVV